MLPRVLVSSRRVGAAALAIYGVISFAYFGSWVVAHPERMLVGRSSDTNVFIWNFAWWPHALLHGENPIYTHAIWAPSGLDLAWAVSSPGLSLAFAPLTLLIGPLASYNVAAVLTPALAAWTAFLLCRYITESIWPSLVGGYLFGFSSWMLGQQADAHLHMVASFLVPLFALVLLQFLDGRIGGRAVTLRLGLLLAAQFAVATELFASLTLACALALAIAFALVPAARSRLRASIAPLIGAYAFAACLVSPLLYYTLTDFRSTVFFPPGDYSADLLNFVLPTQDTAIGGTAAKTISAHFTSNEFEQGAYLGLPTLVIVALFILRRRSHPSGRFLATSLAVATLAALGTALWVEGHRLVPLPWWLAAQLPELDKVFPARLLVYVTLAAAVAVAIWAASNDTPRWLRVALPALAVLALVPHLQAHRWERTPKLPAFFAGGAYKLCLEPGENDLIIPYNFLGDALLWQAKSDFHFRMADGDFGSGFIPPEFAGTTVLRLLHDHGHPGDGPSILELARSKGVSTILLDPTDPWPWQSILNEIEPPKKSVGGMLLYPLKPGLVTDFACIPD
jgi:hypothetical protein